MYNVYNICIYISIICIIINIIYIIYSMYIIFYIYIYIYILYTYILVRCPLQRTESGGHSAWVLEGRSGSNELPIFSDWQCLKWENHRKTIGKWWFNEALWWFNGIFHGIYPLVNVYIAMERSTIFNGKIHYKWPFSIATLNYQRVLADFIRLIHQQFKVAYCEGNPGTTMKSEGVGITRQSRYITKQNRGRTVEAGS